MSGHKLAGAGSRSEVEAQRRTLVTTARCLTVACVLVALTPRIAFACPVCGPGTQDAAWAYLGMTVVLSGLPLLMIGGVGYWVYRRHRAVEPSDVRDH